jgi:hypothetical protein
MIMTMPNGSGGFNMIFLPDSYGGCENCTWLQIVLVYLAAIPISILLIQYTFVILLFFFDRWMLEKKNLIPFYGLWKFISG